MTLDPYQLKAVSKLHEAVSDHVNTILTIPTGGGKSVIAAEFINQIPDRKIIFAVHRIEICNQFSGHLKRLGIPHGMLTAETGISEYTFNRVVVASFDTLSARIRAEKIVPEPCIFICDESHHLLAHTYRKTAEAYTAAGAVLIGLTATPQRLDGRGFSPLMQRLITPDEIGADFKSLVSLKRLVYPKMYSTDAPDFSSAGVVCGDFGRNASFEIVNRSKITGHAIEHYQKYAPGTRAVVFCINKIHAENTLHEFLLNGIKAGILYSGMTERDQTVDDFRSGKIMVLISIDIISEGFDLPEIETCIMLRPTMSIVLYLQQIGRALRYYEGKKHACLIDAVGNVWRHGPPWIAREWTLTGNRNNTRESEKNILIARCAVCFGVYDPKREVCPFCGAGKEKKQRMIKTVDGTLKLLYNDEIDEMEREAAIIESERMAEIVRKKDVRGQVRAARTRDELERIARENKYKPGWVYYWCRLKRIAV